MHLSFHPFTLHFRPNFIMICQVKQPVKLILLIWLEGKSAISYLNVLKFELKSIVMHEIV